MDTGIKATEEEKAELERLIEAMKNAPVMTVRSDIPTFAESARRDYFNRAQQIAISHGLPDGSFYYGFSGGEFSVPPGFEDEYAKLRASNG